MKKIFYILCIFNSLYLLPISAQDTIKGKLRGIEIQTDILEPWHIGGYEYSYNIAQEALWGERHSVQLRETYTYEDAFSFNPKLKRSYGITTQYKYYVLSNSNYSKLYLGVYGFIDACYYKEAIITNDFDNYVFGKPKYYYMYYALGASIGYKQVFWKRLVINYQIGNGISFKNFIGDINISGSQYLKQEHTLDWYWTIDIGYRFQLNYKK